MSGGTGSTHAGEAEELARAEATLWAWQHCVAPSARQAARVAATARAIALMRRWYARWHGGG